MQKLLPLAFCAGLLVVGGIFTAEARPAYARKEGKQCGYCHTSSAGGGAKSFRGIFYGGNNLSFDHFEEKKEAAIAGVDPDSLGSASAPKLNYRGNIGGPATQQIQLASLSGPVLVVFFDSASDVSKKAAENLQKLALAYGQSVSIVGVAEGDREAALKLTADLGNRLRIFPDPDHAAAKKFSVTSGLDMILLAKIGEPIKSWQGFSKDNIAEAVKLLGAASGFDLSGLPKTAQRGGKLIQ